VAADRRPADDAFRRTLLADERTYLAWSRTGLAALGVSIGVGAIVPNVAGLDVWPYAVVGVVYALLGIAYFVYGLRRTRTTSDAIRRGEYTHVDDRVVILLTGLGVLLGLATMVLLLVQL
jgi:putative membrane protein